jgi:hypothetical protein
VAAGALGPSVGRLCGDYDYVAIVLSNRSFVFDPEIAVSFSGE